MFRSVWTVLSKVVRLVVMLSFMVAWLGLVSAQDIGSKQQYLSIGTAVPLGELEAVGTTVAIGKSCTATLIDTNLVLTAAHCVCPSDFSPLNCAMRATFTLHSVFPVDNPNTPVDESKTRQDVSVGGAVRVNPEYGQRGWLREDIAVVQLDQPINQVAQVTPIPVEEPHTTPLVGEHLTLVGFGLTGTGCTGASSGKGSLTLPATRSDFAVIAFHQEGMVACPGDSGGPILNSAGHIVGVASWTDSSSNSYYRPTSLSYNWIFGIAQPNWSSCSWVGVETSGLNSHQAGPAWCPNGSFLVALDLDGDRSISAHDAPVIGQAQCCNLAGSTSQWNTCSWFKVEQQGINSHQPLLAWCPNGSFITQIDLDADAASSANDSPVIGQVQCCTLAGDYSRWGSSYWKGVEQAGINSHQPGEPWCEDGAFLTQFDLDGNSKLDDHDAPIVGQAKCSQPGP